MAGPALRIKPDSNEVQGSVARGAPGQFGIFSFELIELLKPQLGRAKNLKTDPFGLDDLKIVWWICASVCGQRRTTSGKMEIPTCENLPVLKRLQGSSQETICLTCYLLASTDRPPFATVQHITQWITKVSFTNLANNLIQTNLIYVILIHRHG